MGRNAIKLTGDQIAQVEALASFLTSEQVADYIGISRRALYNVFERSPDIAARYKKGRAKAIASISQGVVKRAMDGDNACAFFYLKTQAGWKETQVVELSEVKSFNDMYEDEIEDDTDDFDDMYQDD